MSTIKDRLLKWQRKGQKLQAQARRAKSMKDAGYSNLEIADAMGLKESSVRNFLAKKPNAQK